MEKKKTTTNLWFANRFEKHCYGIMGVCELVFFVFASYSSVCLIVIGEWHGKQKQQNIVLSAKYVFFHTPKYT